MNTEIRQLEPKNLWNKFADLNAVPRPSKKEEQVRAFLRDFAIQHSIDYTEDAVGNFILRKPATKGLENKTKVILQAHMDMVHQKVNLLL